MFRTKNLFSSIPCPYEGSCLLPRCIFKHSHSFSSICETTSVEVENEAKNISRHESHLSTTSSVIKTQESTMYGKPESRDKELTSEADKSRVNERRNFSNGIEENMKKRKVELSTGTSNDISPPALKRKLTDLKPVQAKIRPALKSRILTSAPNSELKKSMSNFAKPILKEALNPRALKVPAPASHDLRYRLLMALYSQFLRLNSELDKENLDKKAMLLLSDQDLVTKALEFEEETAISSPLVYANLIKNKILIYKRMTVKQWAEERAKEVSRAKSSANSESLSLALNGSDRSNESQEIFETGLSPEEDLEILLTLKTDLSGLSNHGYVTVAPTDEEIEIARKGVETSKGWELCDRCKNRFEVFPGRREADGALTSGGTCTYHYGKSYFSDPPAGIIRTKREKKYRCCGQSVGDSPGCTTASCHVFKVSEVKRLASILNFQTTPENSIQEKNIRPVCIDGEMGYTVHGLELIRLTATSWTDGKDLFDILVRPLGPILDLNSRYSGVYPEDMASALPWGSDTKINKDKNNSKLPIVSSPAAARSLLFSYLSPKTPLIGHGLENDLNAVRIIHPTVIDTALLFPHKLGLPYRNSLKALAFKYLKRVIQKEEKSGSNSENKDIRLGHDSREDAIAAGDLVKYAIKASRDKLRRMDQLVTS
ncbi:RNA exonuclease 3 [Golovinomyces cichoracearum]|uniref:RNA exonuclease 3 n=1 Tax=Golovinomyces cichoracearum TaxID=62708 RepID=A0A420I9U5_9PEZI|nr:RNA exonuclease 3 [Golovinomyces cichoracearum]